MPKSPLPAEVINTYLEKVIVDDGCWGWEGADDGRGYGHLRFHGEDYKTNRISYEYHYGVGPGKGWVLHTCDNPPCTKPEHLFLGTPKDNAEDRKNKGRNGDLSGQNNGRAKLTAQQVEEIRLRYVPRVITYDALSKEYGVSPGMISHIVNKRNW